MIECAFNDAGGNLCLFYNSVDIILFPYFCMDNKNYLPREIGLRAEFIYRATVGAEGDKFFIQAKIYTIFKEGYFIIHLKKGK